MYVLWVMLSYAARLLLLGSTSNCLFQEDQVQHLVSSAVHDVDNQGLEVVGLHVRGKAVERDAIEVQKKFLEVPRDVRRFDWVPEILRL